MRKMRLLLLVGLTLALTAVIVPAFASAESTETANKAIFTRPLIWRSDSSGVYMFKGAALTGAEIANDGSVVSATSKGVCELTQHYQTEDLIKSISANWTFTGKVTLEVSVTGNPKDYLPVINGVPLQYKEANSGYKIKWRASLGPNSTLTEVKISYADLSGVVGGFGNELLSGFGVRKQIYIKGSTAGGLYNYQIPVTLGESKKSTGSCDIKLDGGILADFADIRFTQADGETILPHYVEAVIGKTPDRTATIWLKIPEIPKDGLPIYMYYGKKSAADISNGEKVFDFFDDFEGTSLNDKKWKVTTGDKTGRADVAGSALSLYMAKATSADYKFASGLIEYKALISDKGAAVGIIRAGSSDNDDLLAYSSAIEASAHCIAKGLSVKANDPKPIAAGATHTYRIYCDDKGAVNFQRYGADGLGAPQAEVKYSAGTAEALPIGLSSSNLSAETSYEFIRSRKYASPAPQVDIEKTASGAPEGVKLPEFHNLYTAPDGSLTTAEDGSGYYISQLISAPFEARIITPSWDIEPTDGRPVSVTVAVKDGGKFYSGWSNGISRYASKKEFNKGSQLKWKAELSAKGLSESPRLGRFSLEFQPGTIRVVMPKGGETFAPGGTYSIFWETSGYGPLYPVEISYSASGRNNFKVVAQKTQNSGDYKWKVPDNASGKAVIKVADYHDRNIYGISDNYFAIGTGAQAGVAETAVTAQTALTEEPAAEEKEAEEPAAPEKKPAAEEYDLLIKVGDNPAPDGYKDGDIVMIKPAGYLWGAEEKSKFLIVRMKLTPILVKELMQPSEKITGRDRSGHNITKILKKRKHRIDMKDKMTLQERAMAFQGRLSGKPLEMKYTSTATEEKK